MRTQGTKMATMGAGALLMWSAVSGVTHAADAKVYPGMQCFPKASNGGYYLAHYSLFLANEGQTVVDVVCPVTRDNTSNTNGTNAAWVRVRSSNNAPLTCKFTAHGTYGNIVANTTTTTTSNADTSLNVDVDSSAVNGHYAIQCALPPGGRLYTYGVIEP